MSATTEVEIVVSAKKPHRCSWCDQRIDIGSMYKRYRYFDGGDAGTVKMHPECYDAMDRTVAEEGWSYEFMPGDNPRGCNCGHSHGCPTCEAISTDTKTAAPLEGGEKV